MRRRSALWLIAAVGLLALAAWISGDDVKVGERPQVTRPDFPARMRHRDAERLRGRLLPVPTLATAEVPSEPVERDPVLVALPAGGSAVVFEANALRHSALGEMLLRCLEGRRSPLDEFREEAGVDLLEDLDRMGVSDEVVVASGRFEGARWDALLEGHEAEAYGDAATLWVPDRTDELRAAPGMTFAHWRGQLVLIADDEEKLRSAIDRLEGREASDAPVLGENDAYGEIYGVIEGRHIEQLFAGFEGDLGERLRAAAQRLELHVDAMQDVTLVATIDGEPALLGDLARAVGGALSVARLEAQRQGEETLAQLLDFARVTGADGRFDVELAVPLSVLEEHLADCAWMPPARP